MNLRTAACLAAALFVFAPSAHAQQRWAAEIRAGAAFPTADLGDQDLDAGFGFEGTLRYLFMPHLAAYAGWDWMRFGSELDFDVEETGYAFGLRFEHPLAGETGPGPSYWIRAGGTYDHIEIEDDDEITADTGHGLGWEVGGGLAFGVGRSGRLTPGLRYRSLSRDLDVDGAEVPVDLRYLAVELGFAWLF